MPCHVKDDGLKKGAAEGGGAVEERCRGCAQNERSNSPQATPVAKNTLLSLSQADDTDVHQPPKPRHGGYPSNIISEMRQREAAY